MDANTANKLWDEAAKAFSEQKLDVAAQKLETLLAGVGKGNTGPIELLRFNLGYAYLELKDFPKAEKAFTDCLAQFPRGEYASRCFLGIGQARVAINTEESKKKAIEPLQRAAADPKYRSQAGLALGQVYTDLKMEKEAFAVFRSLMGSDISTPLQTIAGVEVIGLLAESGKLDDLVAYLDRLIRQAGIRDSIAWYTNQVIVAADGMITDGKFEPALTLYRTILPRQQILDIQRTALENSRKQIKTLEERAKAQEAIPLSQRSAANNVTEILGSLKSAVGKTEEALAQVEKATDLDAVVIMRRGRCLYYLNRYEEALVCFRTIRAKYPKATDVKAAAYAEIAILHKLKRTADLGIRAKDYVAKYPDADNIEGVMGILGESYVAALQWKEAYDTFKFLEEKFPQSKEIENYILMQGVALMSDGQFADAAQKFGQMVTKFPSSANAEQAYYRIAMCYFLTNDYKNTLKACQDYLNKYPAGQFTGDILYRLSFIDFQNKKEDKSEQILENLGKYVEAHKDDAAAGSMFTLIGDVWARPPYKGMPARVVPDGMGDAQSMAASYYTKAVQYEKHSDEVLEYALDAANGILMDKKDFAAAAKLNGDFIEANPNKPLALKAAANIAKMKIREKKGDEAVKYIGLVLKPRINDPASEQVEPLIDVLLQALVPRLKLPTQEQIKEVEDKVAAALEEIIGDTKNPTTNARVYFARARVREILKDKARADLYIKGIATTTAPEALSPLLLALCAQVLMQEGDLDKAEAMYNRLKDKYQESAYSDAGPVGLGRVALARKQYPEALKLLDAALENKGSSFMYEAMQAKVQTLTYLDKTEEAEKLALDVIADKQAPKTLKASLYLDLANALRKRAKMAVGEAKNNALIDANGRYQHTMTAYKGYPDVAAKAYWGSYEVLTEMGKNSDALDVLRLLIKDPKFEKTEEAKKAKTMVK